VHSVQVISTEQKFPTIKFVRDLFYVPCIAPKKILLQLGIFPKRKKLPIRVFEVDIHLLLKVGAIE